MRLSDVTDQLVSEEAKRTRRTKGAVVEALAEEALRTRRFPGIAFRGSDWDRRPWVIGTALDVWEMSRPRTLVRHTERDGGRHRLTEPQIRLALAYYAEFPEEIDAAIAENERPLSELQRQYPTIDTIAVGD